MSRLRHGLTAAGLLIVVMVGGWMLVEAVASGSLHFKHRDYTRLETPIRYWGLLCLLALGWLLIAIGLLAALSRRFRDFLHVDAAFNSRPPPSADER